ncbi:MAG TPA: glycosyltransferase family 2 protein [Vicinamibacterales bacterium]
MDFTLLVLAAVTALLLTGLFIDFAMGRGQVRLLKDVAAAETGPPLSIIAAARNEARGIEAAVNSLLRLDYPALEIVIVNDRSTDETGEILARLARQHSRLTLTTIQTLPEGWLGKNYALQVGADAATGDLILFTDADVVFEPSTLRRAVTFMEEEKIDHLPVIPDIVVPGVALNAFVAAFGVFFSMYARPWKVRDPRSRAHIGVGAFNLIRGEVYRAIGGHRAIAMRPDDDIKLGKLVKKHGFRQDVAIGFDLIAVEWYASVGELIDGLMKNAFAGVDYSLWKVAGSSIGLFLMHVWPVLAVFLTDGVTRALNAVSVLLIVLIFWAVNGARVAYVLGFPAAALLFIYIMWRSALIAVISGTITWRGTAYPLSQMRANRV